LLLRWSHRLKHRLLFLFIVFIGYLLLHWGRRLSNYGWRRGWELWLSHGGRRKFRGGCRSWHGERLQVCFLLRDKVFVIVIIFVVEKICFRLGFRLRNRHR